LLERVLRFSGRARVALILKPIWRKPPTRVSTHEDVALRHLPQHVTRAAHQAKIAGVERDFHFRHKSKEA